MKDTLEIVIMSSWSAAAGPQTTVGQLLKACVAFDLDVSRLYGKIRLIPIDPAAEIPAIPTFLDVLFGKDTPVDVVMRDNYYPGGTDGDQVDD